MVFPLTPIDGLEILQQAYASDAYWNDEFSDASDLSDLLVLIKFQKFIQCAATMMKQLHFPLLATARGFDFIAEFNPNG